jgi:integrase
MRRPKVCPYRRSDGSYWARVRFVDESGETRNKTEKAKSMADAIAKSNELLKQYEKDSDVVLVKPITFDEFAESFISHIESQSSYKTALGFLNTLRSYFGNKQLNSITHNDVQEYSKKRCKSVSLRTGKRLKRASVNREIALLNRMFNEAIEQRLLVKNPLKDGVRLIRLEQEIRRNRILSEEEEEKLLAVCQGRRAHLHPIIMAALDTGATKSQLLRLTWSDIHVGLRQITVRSPKRVTVRIGEQLADALGRLQENLLGEFTDYFRQSRGGKDAPFFDEWIKNKGSRVAKRS